MTAIFTFNARKAEMQIPTIQIALDDIGHIRPPIAKAAVITVVPDSFQLFKMILDAAVIGACLRIARLINIKINLGRALV